MFCAISDRRCAGVIAAVAGMFLLAAGGASAATTACTAPAVFQPFLSFGDANWYVLPGGESYDNFDGTGWTLSGGAQLLTSALYDGTQGLVLDLPPGAKAVSPAICVNNTYPYLRTMVRTVSGQVNFSLAYATSTGWGASKSTGSVKSGSPAWALSGQVKLPTGSLSGWQMAQMTLTGTGTVGTSDSRLYNLYLDPRMKK